MGIIERILGAAAGGAIGFIGVVLAPLAGVPTSQSLILPAAGVGAVAGLLLSGGSGNTPSCPNCGNHSLADKGTKVQCRNCQYTVRK